MLLGRRLTILSHESYSFVATRHLRRVKINNRNLLSEVMDLLLACLHHSIDFVEWTECDDVLMTNLAMYIQSAHGARSTFRLLSE